MSTHDFLTSVIAIVAIMAAITAIEIVVSIRRRDDDVSDASD